MKTKKHPEANLENYSKLFVQLGMVLSLIIVYSLLQNKTATNQIAFLDKFGINKKDNMEQLIEINIEKPKLKLLQKKVILPTIIKQIDNNKKEDNLFFEDMNSDAPIDENNIVDVTIDEPIDEIFINVEEAPVFPGCKGTKEEKRACFVEKIGRFINRKFNADLASDLGLSPGIKRIFVMFKIDKTGKIVDVKARAPHKRLQEEAIRVIKLIPKMIPGKQQGKPVGVKYSLPIAFKVE
ncbi:energy transducer TonB [Lutibacter sp.]|uniref:energy transducer TonB n=1 Tax=Lutibacter sp. TaxID=1925666 RepID=UPI0025BF09E4|nr:energy transducer TonB [Lutibacter sp.]MCF6180917.1 energy transducer TonB [Lutibacter sp.]